MKRAKRSQWIARQGDVAFIRIDQLPAGDRKKREDATVAYGEVTGHSHRLAVEDRQTAEVLEIGDGLYVHVSEAGLHLKGARFVHEEHGTVTLPAGDYQVIIQREYQPEGIRSVQD